MKIGSPVPQEIAAAASSLRGVRTAAAATAPLPPESAAGAQVHVSAAAASLGTPGASEFDAAKVDAISAAIREGRFEVNPEAIAERLIADAAVLLRPRSV